MRNVDDSILNLTVEQAHAAYFKAVDNGRKEYATKLRRVLSLATKELREALDKCRSKLAHPPKGQTEEDRQKLSLAESRLLRDLSRITEVREHGASLIEAEGRAAREERAAVATYMGQEAPKVTLGEALGLAGLGQAGERA